MGARSRLSTALIAVAAWTAIALVQTSVTATEPPGTLVNLGLYKIELTKYEESGRYEHELAAVASEASVWLAQRARRKGRLADIDETSLSNWPVITADSFGFVPRGPCDSKSSGRHYQVFPFITGRPEFLRDANRPQPASGRRRWLNMGDQDSDLAGGFAERTFKLPDPFYYIP